VSNRAALLVLVAATLGTYAFRAGLILLPAMVAQASTSMRSNWRHSGWRPLSAYEPKTLCSC